MPVDFTMTDHDGNKFDADSDHILDSLRADGYQPVGYSPDGMTFTLKDEHGNYDIDAQDYLKNKGFELGDSKPHDPDYSAVDPSVRAAISALPDDGLKRFYLERHFKQQGIDAPKITGSGRDWYVFNPETNKWLGATNTPDWDVSDLAEAAAAAPRLIGATLGGTLGAAGGILGGAAGAGLGGAGGQAITQTALAAMDPTYRMAVEENSGAFDKDVALTGLSDAALGALPPALKSSVLGRFASSPISSVAKGLGAVAEPVGNTLSSAAKVANMGPVSRGIGTGLVPGLNQAQAAGFMSQIPSKLSSWAAETLGGMPKGISAEEALAGFGGKLGEGAKMAGQKTGKLFDELGRFGSGLEKGAEEVYGAGAKAVGKAGDVLGQAGSVFRRAGDTIKPYEPYLLGEPAAEEVKARLMRQKNPNAPLPNRPTGSTI